MRNQNGFYVGWSDTSVRDVSRECGDLLSQFSFALVTCVDSDQNVVEMEPFRHELANNPSVSVVGSSVALPVALWHRVFVDSHQLSGFDEVWFFDNRPELEKPKRVHLVGPLNLSREPLPNGLAEWMMSSACRLGLGDGIGMNFVASSPDVARQLAGEVRRA